MNVHKTFRRRPGHLLDVLCTFSLHPVSTGELHNLLLSEKIFSSNVYLVNQPVRYATFFVITFFHRIPRGPIPTQSQQLRHLNEARGHYLISILSTDICQMRGFQWASTCSEIKTLDYYAKCVQPSKKGVLENFPKLTGKRLCGILFFNKFWNIGEWLLLCGPS